MNKKVISPTASVVKANHCELSLLDQTRFETGSVNFMDIIQEAPGKGNNTTRIFNIHIFTKDDVFQQLNMLPDNINDTTMILSNLDTTTVNTVKTKKRTKHDENSNSKEKRKIDPYFHQVFSKSDLMIIDEEILRPSIMHKLTRYLRPRPGIDSE